MFLMPNIAIKVTTFRKGKYSSREYLKSYSWVVTLSTTEMLRLYLKLVVVYCVYYRDSTMLFSNL